MPIRNFQIGIHVGLCLVLCSALFAPDAFGQVLNQCPGQVTIPWTNALKIRTELNKQKMNNADRQKLIQYHLCIAKHYVDLLRKTQAKNCQAVLQAYFDAAQNLTNVDTSTYPCEVPDNLRPPS
jgi:hypothetical protein